jgi:hypothetical protein
MAYLLSYPRSGNHLLRALIEALTQRPTSSFYAIAGDDRPLTSRTGAADDLGVDLARPPAYFKVHRLAHLGPEIDRGAPLVFALRDPFESISSDFRAVPHVLLRISGRWHREWEHVVENVREFDGWQGPKVLLYFEDLMQAPAPAIRTLGQFLDVDRHRIEEVIAGFGDIGQTGLKSLPRAPRSQADPAYYRKKTWFPARLSAPADLKHYFARYDSVD